MSKDKRIPYTWQEIEDQIRESIIAQASMIGTFGPQDNYTDVISSFLGTNVEICAAGDITDEEEARIDSTRHRLYYYAHEAYNFAYQIDDRFCTSEAYDIDCGLLNGYAQTDNHGTPAPLCTRNDFPLRRVFQTYLARKNLQNGESLTIRELSLLSNMGEPTVRSSISKEGFQLESEPNTKEDKSRVRLSAEDAYVWL
jgi:hypothetical protein